MKKRPCWVCEGYDRLRSQADSEGIRVAKERPIAFICREHQRFVLFGPLPKTRRDVDQLAGDLKRRLGMTKTPGSKARAGRPNILKIEEQILKNEEWTSLKDIAAQMGMTPRAIREAIRDGMGAPDVTFKQFQALVFTNSKKSIDKTRLSMSKLKKSRRMF